MSQFTPQELEEFEFRQRAEQEFASKQKPDQRDTETAVSNVVYPAAGAAVGAAVGSLPTKIVNGMVQDPMTGKWMAVENYARQMAQGKYYGGQNYNQVWDKIREYNADPTQGPRLEKEAMANRSTGQKMLASTPKPLQGIVSAPMGVIGRSAIGLGAGMQGSDALNRYKAGDTSGAVISGLGALGTAAAMIPHPVTRIGGTAIGLGAEGLNAFLDYLKQKSQKPQAPQPKQMAEGGSAKKKMSKAERAAKAIRENNKKKVPHLSNGGSLGPMVSAFAKNAVDMANQFIGSPISAAPVDNSLPVKFGTEAPNTNPYGFIAPTGPASQALVPYYNKATGQTWNAPSGGYTPPSSDWFQGSPDSSQITPMPGFAPGMDPIAPYMPQRAPNMIATEDPEFYKRAAEEVRLNSMPQRAPTGGIITEAPPSQNLLDEIRGVTTPPTNAIGSGLGSLTTTNAPKPVASITQQQPFQQRRVAPPLRGTMNPPIKPRTLPYTAKPIPKPMPRRRMFAEGGSTTPAWQRAEGKSPSGGLNAVGRASYKRETGGELKAPQPEGGSRKKSFCARMGGMKKKLTSSKTANDPDSRINKALRKWKC